MLFDRVQFKTEALYLTGLILLLLCSCRPQEQKPLPPSAASQKDTTAPPPPYHYTHNDKYTEQMDFCSVFDTKARIVMLGNSHTYRMYWNELMQRNDIVNRGIGSDITAGYINRLEFVLKVQPRICFIEGGGNDIYRNIPVDTTIGNIAAIVKTLKQKKIIPVLTHLFYAGRNYPNVDSNGFNSKVALLNKALDSLAASEKVELINLDDQLNKEHYLSDEYVQQDGIHLKSKAYLVWRAAIRKILKKHRI